MMAPASISDEGVIEAGAMSLGSEHTTVTVARRPMVEHAATFVWRAPIQWRDQIRALWAGKRSRLTAILSAQAPDLASVELGRAYALSLARSLGLDPPEADFGEVSVQPGATQPGAWMAVVGVGGHARPIGEYPAWAEALGAARDARDAAYHERVERVRAARGGTLDWGVPIPALAVCQSADPRDQRGSA